MAAGFALASCVLLWWAVQRYRAPGKRRRAVRVEVSSSILSVALLLTGASFVAFPLLNGLLQLACAAFVIGMSLGCAQPLSMALVYRTAPPHRAGEAAGFRIAITSFSQTTLPMLFGALGAVLAGSCHRHLVSFLVNATDDSDASGDGLGRLPVARICPGGWRRA